MERPEAGIALEAIPVKKPNPVLNTRDALTKSSLNERIGGLIVRSHQEEKLQRKPSAPSESSSKMSLGASLL
jgi:hypothetical protein